MTQWRSPGRDLLAGGAGCPCRVSEMAWVEAGSSCVGVEPQPVRIWISGYLLLSRRTLNAGPHAHGNSLQLLECNDRSRWADACTRVSISQGRELPLPGTPPSC